MQIMTCDNEWSHEELYGVGYDECMKACRNIGFLLDTLNLDKPNILMETIMNELGDKNLVDIYDDILTDILLEKCETSINEQISDEAFARWDQWMQKHIKDTLLAHKYKYYTKK